ncbi:MAG: GNAT family N-acetyltransferase [Sphingomonadaceae bacterium]
MQEQSIIIKHVENDGANGQSGEYVALMDGQTPAGVLIWTQRGDARVAEHTIVEPEFRGAGVAALLVDALIKDASSQGFTIVPQCTYVAKQFQRHPEWADLLA